MRKFIKLAFCSFGVFMVSVFATTNTWAATCLQASLSDGTYIGEMVDHTCCDALSTTRYYRSGITTEIVSVTSCSTCKGLAGLTTYDIESLVNYNGTACQVYNVHSCTNPECDNCTSTSWAPYSTGYERMQTATCECGSCTKKYAYRCAAGYYGLPLGSASGCTKCNESFTNTCSVSNGTGSQTCYHTSSPAGSGSSSACTGTENCGSCCATSCSSGYHVSNCACVADVTTATITFRSGSYSMTQTCTSGQSVALKARSNMTAPVSSTYGWNFNGWATDVSSSNITYYDGQSITCPSSNLTLYGVWKRDITFKYYDGSDAESVTTNTKTQYFLNTGNTTTTTGPVTTYALSTQNSYSWSPMGWIAGTSTSTQPSYNGILDVEGSTVQIVSPGATSLYRVYWAIYERRPQVVYNKNGGTGSMSNSYCDDNQQIIAGGTAMGEDGMSEADCTLSDGDGFVAPANSEFAGWALGSASGTVYDEGETFHFPNKSWTSYKTYNVYATWATTGVTITLDKNGGTGMVTVTSISGDWPSVTNIGGGSDETITCIPGAVFRVSGVSKSNATYDGLSTSSSGTGNLSITCPSSSGSTYYMIWSCDAGYYYSSGTCTACAKGTYKASAGNATSCTTASNKYYVNTTAATSETQCPSGYRDGSDGGRDAITDCYKNVTRGCTQQCINPDSTGCYGATCSGSCSCAGGTYKQYTNSAGTGNGSTSGTTSNETCPKTVISLTANDNYYVNGTTSCPACSSQDGGAYPYSDGGNYDYNYCYRDCVASDVPGAASVKSGGKRYSDNSGNTCEAASCDSGYYYTSSSGTCTSCSTVNNTTTTQSGTDTTSTSTCPDGTTTKAHATATSQTYTQTCNGKYTGGAGGTSGSSACTGCSSYGTTKTYGTCVATACATGYSVSSGACVADTNTIILGKNGGTGTIRTTTSYTGTTSGSMTCQTDTANVQLPTWQATVSNSSTYNYKTNITYGTKVFLGWSTDSNCTSSSCAKTTITCPNSSTTTYYAVWGSCTCGTDSNATCAVQNTSNNTCQYKHTCTNGYYHASNGATITNSSLTCTQCQAGAYCPSGATDETPCSNGTYSAAGATSCSNCTTGYTNSGTTAAAHANASSCKATVTLNKNGGSGTIQGTNGTGDASITCSQGVSCNFGNTSSLSQTGYTFAGGWGTSSSCSTTTTTSFTNPTGTYYACKKANTNTITLSKNGGSGTVRTTRNYTSTTSGSMTCTTGTENVQLPTWQATVSTAYTYKTNITKAGKVFLGWSTDSSCDEASCAYTSITCPTGDTTYYAVWGTPVCNINNGTGTVYTTSMNAATGLNRPRCTVTCNSGYNDAFSSGAQYGTAGEVNVNYTCAANTITLAWANGGHGTAPTTPASCTYGGTFTAASAITGVTGYTFNKWSVNNKTFSAGATVNCTNADLGVYTGTATLTATWTGTTNTITLKKNGGTGTVRTTSNYTSTTDATMTCTSGTTNVALPTWVSSPGTTNYRTNITKSKAIFLGWSTSSTCTTASCASTSITCPTGNTTYYAVWSACTCGTDSHATCSVQTVSANTCQYKHTCASGYYNASNGSDTNPSNTMTCSECGSGKYCPSGATKPNNCSSLGGGLFTQTDSTTESVNTRCYVTTTAGKWIETSQDTALKNCTAGSYCPGNVKVYYTLAPGGSIVACAAPYSNSAANSDDENDCYLTLTAGEYVPTAGGGASVCGANTWSASTANIYKGGSVTGRSTTSSCTNCTSGYTTSGNAASNHDAASDCSITITLKKNGSTGTIQGTGGTNDASVTCQEGETCNFGSASSLVPTASGYKMSGGWGTSSTCTSTTTSFTTPTTTTYYACKSTCSYTNSTAATPSSNVCAGTCKTGYSTSGGSNTGTAASCSGTTCTCSPKTFTVTLNDSNNGGSGGSGTIYTTYNTNVYKDSGRSNAMTSSANPVTKPSKSNGYKFLGYYNSSNGTTQYIDENGYITSAGLSAGKALTANGTWYARYESMSVGMLVAVSHTYDGTAKSCDGDIDVEVPASGATVTYSETSGGTYTSTMPTITNPGEKTIYFKVSAPGYTDYYGSYWCTMNRLTLNPASGTITYPTTTTTFTAACASGGPVTVSSRDTGVATVSRSSTPTNGAYTVTVTWIAAGSGNNNASTVIDVNCTEQYEAGDGEEIEESIYAPVSGTYSVTTAKGSSTTTVKDGSTTVTNSTSTIVNGTFGTNKTLTATCSSGATPTVASATTAVATASISSGTITLTPVKAGDSVITVTCPATAGYKSSTSTFTYRVARASGATTLSATAGTITYPTTTTTFTAQCSDNAKPTASSATEAAATVAVSSTATNNKYTVTVTWVAAGSGNDTASSVITVTCPQTDHYASSSKTYTATTAKGNSTTTVKDGSATVTNATSTIVNGTFGTTKSLTASCSSGATPTVASATTAVATASINNGTITLTPVKAGDSVITVTCPATAGYKSSTSTFTYRVARATGATTLSATAGTITYPTTTTTFTAQCSDNAKPTASSATEAAATVAVSSTATNNKYTVTVTWVAAGSGNDTAGSVITVTCPQTDHYASSSKTYTATTAKGNGSTTVKDGSTTVTNATSTIVNGTYGTNKTLTATCSSGATTAVASATTAVATASISSGTITLTPVKAGDSVITVTCPATTGYKSSTSTFTYRVARASGATTLSATAGTITYPTTTTTFTAQCSDNAKPTASSATEAAATVAVSSTATNNKYTVTVTWVAAGSGNDTASSVITVTCPQTDHYASSSKTYTATTAKGNSTTTVKDGSTTVTNSTSTIVNGTYGTNKTLTATCSSGATPTVASATTAVATASISSGTITLTPVKAGDSVITVTCPATTGYKSSTSTFTYRVARATGATTLSATAGTITYPTTTTTFTAQCSDNVKPIASSATEAAATVAVSSTATNNKYTVTVTWVAAGSGNDTASSVITVTCPQTDHYASSSKTYTATTAKGNSTTTVKDGSTTVTNATSTIVNGTFGTTKSLTATCSSGATPTVASATTAVATASISSGTITLTPVKAGDSVITVTCPATAGYKSSTSTFTYRVARATGATTLSATAGTITYPTTTTTFTAQCSDNAKPTASSATEAAATVAVSSTATNNKYTVTVTWVAAGSGNDTASSVITVTCPQTDHYASSSKTYTATTAKGNSTTTVKDGSTTVTNSTSTIVNGTFGTNKTLTATCSSGATPTVASATTAVATASISSGTITLTPVKAGDSVITVTCPATAGYKSSTSTFTYRVARATGATTLSATAGTITYPTTTTTFTAQCSDNAKPTASSATEAAATVAVSSTATNNKYTVTVTWVAAGSGNDTASSVITVTCPQTDHYASSSKTYTATTAKGNGSTTLSSTSSTLTYNGTGTTNTFTAKCADGVKPTATSSNTNAATVAVSSSADANGNYTITNTWVGAGSGDNNATSTITVSCAAGAHYKSSSATHTLTTAKKANTLTLSASSGTVTYPEASKTFTVSTNTSSGTLSISSNSDSTVATASLSGTTVTMTPKKSGSTTITVASAATDYYKSATATYNLTVADKTIVLKKNGGTGTCGGASSTNDGSMTCTYADNTCTVPSWHSTSCNITNGSGSSAKVFIGWDSSSSATTATYAGGTNVKNATSPLYAIWKAPTCSKGTGVNTTSLNSVSNNAPVCNRSSTDGYYCSATQTGTAGSLNVNVTCTAASDGYFAKAGATAQTACAVGSYSTASSASSTCTVCPAGKTTSGTSTHYNANANTACATTCSNASGVTQWLTPRWESNNTVISLCAWGCHAVTMQEPSGNFTDNNYVPQTVYFIKDGYNGYEYWNGIVGKYNDVPVYADSACSVPLNATDLTIYDHLLPGVEISGVTNNYICSANYGSFVTSNPLTLSNYSCTSEAIENGWVLRYTTSCTNGYEYDENLEACEGYKQSEELYPNEGTGGSSTLYFKYGTGAYLDEDYTMLMSTSANPITIPTRTGYHFDGYYLQGEYSNSDWEYFGYWDEEEEPQIINENGYITSDGIEFAQNFFMNSGMSIYARWTANTNTITLNGNSASGGKIRNTAMTSGAVTFTCTTDSSITLPTWSATDSATTTSIYKGKKRFLGWATSSTATAAETITTCPTGAQTYYAVWSADCTCGTDSNATCAVQNTSNNTCQYKHTCTTGYYHASNGATITNSSLTCTVCPAGSFCPAGATESTLCAAGSYTASTGQSACTACQNGTTNTGASATTQKACGTTCSNSANVRANDSTGWETATWTNNSVSKACTIKTTGCATNYYYNSNACTACPAPADHKRTTFPDNYYATKVDSTGTANSAGTTAITGCRALTWISGPRGILYEYATYNSTSGKYDNSTSNYGWSDVNAGYYLTTKGSCGAYAYYKDALVCPEGSYCPGKSRVSCSPSNQSTVHTTNFGLESCPTAYPNSAAGSDDVNDCYLTLTKGNYVAEVGAGAVTCTCGGYCDSTANIYYGGTVSGRATTGGRTGCGAGKYNANTGSQASSACSTASAGYYASSSCSQTPCANWSYSGAGASSCTNCPTLDSGYVKSDSTSTGWTVYTKCVEVASAAPTNCASGKLQKIPTASGSTTWAAATVNTTLKAKQNYYVNGTACSACSGLASGFYPNSAANNTGGASACYTNNLSGKYVKTENATSATNCAAGTYKGTHTVNYGSTSSCDNCGDGAYSAAAAASCTACATGSYSEKASASTKCVACPAGRTTSGTGTHYNATANTACATTCTSITNLNTWGTQTWSSSNNTVTGLCTVGTCKAGAYKSGNTCPVCGADTYSASTGATSCTSCLTNYHTSGTALTGHDNSNDCKISCDGGYYVKTANDTTCTAVGAGKYAAASTIAQGSTGSASSCSTGLTTIGFGAGADEAGDCGHKFHASTGVLYLRSNKKTTPSLNVRIGDTVFYGNMTKTEKNMSYGVSKKLKVKNADGTYYVHDDSVDEFPSEYTPVEYIQSNGAAYINTGYKLQSNNVVYEWSGKDNASSGSTSLFGVQGSQDGGTRYSGILYGNKTSRRLYVGSSTSLTVGYASNDTSYHDWRLTLQGTTVTLDKDSTTVGTQQFSGNTYRGNNVFVFSNSSNGSVTQQTQVAMKYFRIIDNGDLKFNGIPVKRNSDSKCGFYDTVSGTFFGSGSSTAFTCQ